MILKHLADWIQQCRCLFQNIGKLCKIVQELFRNCFVRSLRLFCRFFLCFSRGLNCGKLNFVFSLFFWSFCGSLNRFRFSFFLCNPSSFWWVCFFRGNICCSVRLLSHTNSFGSDIQKPHRSAELQSSDFQKKVVPERGGYMYNP